MTARLTGRAALITGAARGIGHATARVFAGEGARLGLIDRDAAQMAKTAGELATGHPGAAIYWRAADIGDFTATSRAVDELARELGGLDILVNNAAARAYGPVLEATPESWNEILQTNVTGLANCSRAALPHLRKGGSGSIVNVSSAFALSGRVNMGQYDASKAAVLALTRVLACEEAPFGIRVNAVCPGSTLTPWTLGRAAARGMSIGELRQKGAAPSLLGRWAEPEEIAFPILWLASGEASFVTGIALPVDGGLTAM
jgi:meso-butanediol dehydrogenase/(S,S)-butanediol dehydrogenase/diacetyl reductase